MLFLTANQQRQSTEDKSDVYTTVLLLFVAATIAADEKRGAARQRVECNYISDQQHLQQPNDDKTDQSKTSCGQ